MRKSSQGLRVADWTKTRIAHADRKRRAERDHVAADGDAG